MDMSYWITARVPIIVGILGSTGVWMLIQNRRDKKSIERKIMLGIAFLGVKMSCRQCLDRGYADVEEIEDIEKYLYEPYVAMGGNGTAEMLMNKVKALPNKPRKEENS